MHQRQGLLELLCLRKASLPLPIQVGLVWKTHSVLPWQTVADLSELGAVIPSTVAIAKDSLETWSI